MANFMKRKIESGKRKVGERKPEARKDFKSQTSDFRSKNTEQKPKFEQSKNVIFGRKKQISLDQSRLMSTIENLIKQ